MKEIFNILLWIHIPAGTLSLILFWIPVFTKKGGNIHRKVGKLYYMCMWVVLASAAIMSIISFSVGNYIMASFLGFLAILTGYPLWYSYEILNQKKEWTEKYFNRRKAFNWLLFVSSTGMVIGAFVLRFSEFGVLMAFFGLMGVPAIRDARMSKEFAMTKENRLGMHIQGTIISGIAAYTAFLSFGGRTLFGNLLPGMWQILPWILPTIIGVVAIKLMKKKYKVST